ncbi:hypothetical protein BZA05DRAFT_443592 [Tricharina praecox]|uniref:uncharacterized protein n=1 Tax=Tricharina praecox TaxID=43433 RepID=UPI00221E636F|nr:uncharacterized protein BZA05DRAFT_443592 [Tricharina praecox]KAI5854967.1 hypothetical protein BZA05DRAFT_443592 [Tricharina praecox]
MVSFRTRTGRLFDTWSAFIILFLISTTSAHHQNLTAGVQVHNHTTPLGTMTFAKEPGGRGTWSIIFSCTATFAFCVWTAVHPDTISGLSTRRRILYRTILMVIAAINPEAIAVLSYRQWRSARKIKTDWKKHFDALQHPRKHEISAEELEVWQTKKDKWCGELKMTAAFFVVMGGFVIDKSKATSNERSKDKYQGKFARFKKPAAATGNPGHFIATLTPRGFLEYLKEGYFNDFENPPFKTYEIMDKNKEDCFGKILASLQTLWLLVQSIQRYRSNLTITQVHVKLPSSETLLTAGV